MATSRAAGRSIRKAVETNGPDIFSPAMQRPLASLLSQAYGKPVELNLTKLSQPHLDSDIFASIVAQRLKDRTTVVTRALRKDALNVPMPTSIPSIAEHAATAVRSLKRRPALRSVGRKRTSVATIVEDLKLKKVSSVEIGVGGRLGRRMTADRTTRKSTRMGLTWKGPGLMVRNIRPLHVRYSFRDGKRRVGAFGVKVRMGHS